MTQTAETNWISEFDFVDGVIDDLCQYITQEKGELSYYREVSVGRSIADIVFATQKSDKAQDINNLSAQEAVILATLRKTGSTRIDLLEKRCGLSHKELRTGKHKRFLQGGIICRGKGGQIKLQNIRQDSITIIAIEAKLTDWKKALKQAKSYYEYADESYVLLPEENAEPALQSQDCFESNGIGLIIANDDSLNIAIRPRPNNDYSWKREFVYSRLH